MIERLKHDLHEMKCYRFNLNQSDVIVHLSAPLPCLRELWKYHIYIYIWALKSLQGNI